MPKAISTVGEAASDRNGLFPDEQALPAMIKIQLLSLRTSPPQPVIGPSGSKSARLVKLGWRILPVPRLIRAGVFGTDDNGNPTHPALLDFKHADDFLIVPPDDSPRRAERVAGKNRAISRAFAIADEEGML